VQFLPFYALLYVDNPGSHPTFKDLFRPQWSQEVKRRIGKFLSGSLSAHKGADAPSTLVKMYLRGSDGEGESPAKGSHAARHGSILEDRIALYERELIDVKKKSLETQMCGHGLLKVTPFQR